MSRHCIANSGAVSGFKFPLKKAFSLPRAIQHGAFFSVQWFLALGNSAAVARIRWCGLMKSRPDLSVGSGQINCDEKLY